MSTSTRKDNSALFQEAPSQNLAFPQNEAITAVEILVYDPNKIRSHDTIFRLSSNEATNQIVETIINYHREESDKGEAEANSLCKIMQKSMRDWDLYHYPGMKKIDGVLQPVLEPWRNTLHKKFNTKDFHGPWDASNLECTGYVPDLSRTEDLVRNIRFDSLAVGVKRHPSIARGDGLNLTSCVQYAVAHPDENWIYPRDFTALTEKLGRRTVQPHHLDGAVFARFKGGQTPNPPAPLIPSRRRIPVAQPAITVPIAPILLAYTQQSAIPAAPVRAAPRRRVAHPATRQVANPTVPKPSKHGVQKSSKPRNKGWRSGNDDRATQLQRNPGQVDGNITDFGQYLLPGDLAALARAQNAVDLLYQKQHSVAPVYDFPVQSQAYPYYNGVEDAIMSNAGVDPGLSRDASRSKTPTPEEIDQYFDDWESGFTATSPYTSSAWAPPGPQVAMGDYTPFDVFSDSSSITPIDPSLEQYQHLQPPLGYVVSEPATYEDFIPEDVAQCELPTM